jgi:DnaJ-class molecular chaperone
LPERFRPANLGISSIILPCKTLREYFYRISEREGSAGRQALYDILQVPCTASPGELRVSFKLQQLELEGKRSPRNEHVLLERAFNILGDPGLRACYDALLKDPDAPALFPYGGFGSLLISGERSRNGQTFFARRIIAFLPERHRRRFQAPVRKCEFYSDRALYRDIRMKLELWIDPAVLHHVWEPDWNRWKHLLGAIYEVVGLVKQKI